MALPSIATPNLLVNPGRLFWAPLGTTLPTGTVTGSVFTDTWPVAWIPLGMTDSGSVFKSSTTVSPNEAAESLDPIKYLTVSRTGEVTFMLKDFTATNLSRAFNGAVTTVTGSTTTTMTTIDPVQLGLEIRCMIGYESEDSTFRWVANQVLNSGDITLTMAKAPANTSIPWTGVLEKPSTAQPWKMWTAGEARA